MKQQGFFLPDVVDSGPNTISQCGLCRLFKKMNHPRLEPVGSGRRRVLFVGSHATKEDDSVGAFQAKHLSNILWELGVSLDDCLFTKATICGGTPKDAQYKHCRPNLMKTIRDYAPKVIVPLGIEATRAVLADEWRKNYGAIDKWAGYQIPVLSFGAWVCPTYSPTFAYEVVQDEVMIRFVQEQISLALALEDKALGAQPLSYYIDLVRVLSSKEAVKWLETLLKEQSGDLAFDYETTGLKPDSKEQEIVSVSFCWAGVDTVAFMWDDAVAPLVSKVLQSKKFRKIASNMKFEDRWTRAKLGHPVARWYWDTMLAAHLIDNRRGITSIKFQSFVELGIGDYDAHIHPYLDSGSSNGLNRIRELDKDELLLYNGLDSLLEYVIYQKQREVIGL